MKRIYQGDIVLVEFPFSDFSDKKFRPAIVVSNANVNRTEDVILAAISSTVRNDNFSFELTDDLLTEPLDHQCEVRCNKLFMIEKSIIKKRISRLNELYISKLYDKVNYCIEVV